MHKKMTLLLFIALTVPAMAQKPARLVRRNQTNSTRMVSFDLLDNRKVILQDIDRHLRLRITKDGSAGWEVAVVHKPDHADSSLNLLYQSLAWHGPHPSQIEAWQIADKYFPDHRPLDVNGYPYRVTIDLINPVVEVKGPSARFVSGTVQVSWSRTSFANPRAQQVAETSGSTAQSSRVPRAYILKAWQLDNDLKTYLWSIEETSEWNSPDIIYESLSSASLRARIGAFPPGTRISFRFSGAGNLDTINAATGKDFQDFEAFCKSKRIIFDHIINTD
jgi:hypothetical protein